jgi:hypothetical protein
MLILSAELFHMFDLVLLSTGILIITTIIHHTALGKE